MEMEFLSFSKPTRHNRKVGGRKGNARKAQKGQMASKPLNLGEKLSCSEEGGESGETFPLIHPCLLTSVRGKRQGEGGCEVV